MLSGRSTFENVQKALREERSRLKALDKHLKAVNDRLLRIEAERIERLEELARIRLAAGQATSSSHDWLSQGLAERDAERERLSSRLADLEEEVERLRAARPALVAAVEEADLVLDEAEAATQASLSADPEFQAARLRAQEAQEVARLSAEKAAANEAERVSKGAAFEGDRLFMYLWRRGYGTRDYRGRGIVRWLDGKVADLVDYDLHRPNYARLIELPLRLREHADEMEARAMARLEELARLEDEARVRDGIDGLAEALERAEAALREHEERVAQAEGARDEAFDALERMDRGEDDAYQELLTRLSRELERQELVELRRTAAGTPLGEDDAIVARLDLLEQERARAKETAKGVAETSAASRQRIAELERFLHGFEERGYDSPGSGFPDGDLVENMLGQFLRGVITRQVLWEVLDGQHRGPTRRSDPTFGSGGFGRGSPWTGGGFGGGSFGGGGSVRRGGGSIGRGVGSTGGGMSRGGFRTGGTMRRGGFKTGGKK